MKANALQIAVAAALLGAVSLPSAAQASGDPWNWRFNSYIWASDVTVDFGDRQSNVSFSDIMDKRDASLLFHVEGQGDNWGMLADIIYLDLGDSRDLNNARVKADIKTSIIDLAAVYSPGDTRFLGLEGFAGIRYMSSDFSADVTPNTPTQPVRRLGLDRNLTDFLIGARYTVPLSDKWSISFRGDTSFGDSEGSWSAAINARRQLGRGSLLIGYRYLDLELKPDVDTLNIQMSGPQVAYAFAW
jgi:hypothetical protein